MITSLNYAYIEVNNIHDEKTGAWQRTYSSPFCDITRHDSHPSFRVLADLLGILQPSPLSQGHHTLWRGSRFRHLPPPSTPSIITTTIESSIDLMLRAPTPTSRWGLDLSRGWADLDESGRPSRGVHPGNSVRVFVDGFEDVKLNRRNAIAIFDYQCHGSYILVLDPGFQSTFVVW